MKTQKYICEKLFQNSQEEKFAIVKKMKIVSNSLKNKMYTHVSFIWLPGLTRTKRHFGALKRFDVATSAHTSNEILLNVHMP
jgi:hypothetical protein